MCSSDLAISVVKNTVFCDIGGFVKVIRASVFCVFCRLRYTFLRCRWVLKIDTCNQSFVVWVVEVLVFAKAVGLQEYSAEGIFAISMASFGSFRPSFFRTIHRHRKKPFFDNLCGFSATSVVDCAKTVVERCHRVFGSPNEDGLRGLGE